jgi:sigma-B regulation protein RsbU (phosphoserine phosphatase)
MTIRRFSPKTLRQRVNRFVLIPVFLLLTGMGFSGFWYARNILLTQWGEAAILKLQRAAHHVDMRLEGPKKWIDMLHAGLDQPGFRKLQEMIMDRIRSLEGVTEVDLKGPEACSESIFLKSHPRMSFQESGDPDLSDHSGMHPLSRAGIVEITPPQFHTGSQTDAVTLASDLMDSNNCPVGRLEVFIQMVKSSGWWQSHRAYLVDETGNILAATSPEKRKRLGEEQDPLELEVLRSIGDKSYGIVFGKGIPVSEICGFYRLTQAPWYLVMFAPGKEILHPILIFRTTYFLAGIFTILIIVLLIHLTLAGPVGSIRQVSQAAQHLADGVFGPPLPVSGRDEVGELITSFNRMVRQLQDRLRMKESLNLAMEIQQNLLPLKTVRFHHLDIAGNSLYCDEIGGDYYDLLEFPTSRKDRIGVVVGDGAEHGVPAALLMTTVRALLRSRIWSSDTLSEAVSAVNRLLCLDTERSGAFMTLFLMVLDTTTRDLSWIRAGHDPAILYDPNENRFQELQGEGIVLGLDPKWNYEEQHLTGWRSGQIIVIGTDGIWETENPSGERYGKARLHDIIQKNCHRSASQILDAIMESILRFREEKPALDDITLVVIRIEDEQPIINKG